ncbi:hypothetical protein [Listeria booriae]|uniref:hypothetical protein n=1 Tax=Listeria booriae TaxID=1552123 RepID=UPI0016271056|nr:hypothetical protein [Listeria booriae]MBC1212450.1 hypothetical protein [Listeria booriae]MBC1309326.1 hypothetical protein [Listeria booriae]MBC1920320.1 hypothetical protein [Listeria booriae]
MPEKYTKAERDKKRKLLHLYFESEGLDKEDAMHELVVEKLAKHGVEESHKPYLEKIKLLQERYRENGAVQSKITPNVKVEGVNEEWKN